MSSPEQKINSLLDRIRREPSQIAMSSPPNVPQSGPMRRPSLPPASRNRPGALTFKPRTTDLNNSETDKKLKDIMKISGNLTINNTLYKTDFKDMLHIEELGNGTCGHVVKMMHKPSNEIIAVKQMRRSGNNEENKRIIMDIEVVLKSHGCKYIVQSLGCFINDTEVWICMELMTTCLDKLVKLRGGIPIPEDILGKVTVATVEALSYLKDQHDVIHRDVKPSNILLDTKGYVKLCDFGISGRLVDSMAKTRSAGCAAYLAPERIEPDPQNPDYDIRADVWSLGITLVELATGRFPYPDCQNDFEVLTKVINLAPPSLPNTFSPEFRDFVQRCLTKDSKRRPKYTVLKTHAFIKKYEKEEVNVGDWVKNALKEADAVVNKAAPRPSIAQSTLRRFFPSHQQQPASPPQPPIYPQIPILTNGNSQCKYKPLRPPDPNPPLGRPVGHISRLGTFRAAAAAATPNSHQNTTETTEQKIDGSPYKSLSPFQAYQSHVAAKKEQVEVAVGATELRGRVLSPFQQRRVASESRWRSPSASPLPLRAQLQGAQEAQQYNCGNTSPIVLQRFYHQQKQQQLAKEAEETGKKRFASYIKLQIGGDRSGRSSRHQSPDPPPRLNRTISGENQSPLALHRAFLDSNPPPSSPSLSRRYVSPTPPVPPPRRLSESTSVPGSPQHFRARFHYTPEPQRRLFHNSDVT